MIRQGDNASCYHVVANCQIMVCRAKSSIHVLLRRMEENVREAHGEDEGDSPKALAPF